MNSIRRFWSDDSGMFAVKFALILTPLLISIGVAIDLSRLHNAKVNLQDAVDSSALHASKLLYDETKGFEDKSEELFVKNLDQRQLESIDIYQANPTATNSVIVSAKVSVKPQFVQIFGYPKLKAAAISEAIYYPKEISDVVLVLDHTGSLRGSPWVQLKKGLDHLFASLPGDNELDGMRLGMVTFASTVNVGKDHSNWLEPYNAHEFGAGEWEGCLMARGNGLDENDGPPVMGSKFTPYLWPSDPTNDWAATADSSLFSIDFGPNRRCGVPLLNLRMKSQKSNIHSTSINPSSMSEVEGLTYRMA